MSSPGADPRAESSAEDSTQFLSARARTGSAAEIEALYLRTLPALLAWIELRRRTGAGLRIDPGDLAQEVWLRVLQNIGRFDPALGCFRAWILGIAKTVWLEHSNPRRKGAGTPLLASDTALARAPDSVTSATRALARDESIGRFLAHVDQLDPLDRMVVLHHGMEGLGCAETGQRLDLSAEAVSKRWQRVRARLGELRLGHDLMRED